LSFTRFPWGCEYYRKIGELANTLLIPIQGEKTELILH
jgi:hypothetical protein